jgi:hypothetical protein
VRPALSIRPHLVDAHHCPCEHNIAGDANDVELRLLGIKEYRQAFFKPYRIIYRVIGEQVVVYVIADGRRDMQTLLSRRLLGR